MFFSQLLRYCAIDKLVACLFLVRCIQVYRVRCAIKCFARYLFPKRTPGQLLQLSLFQVPTSRDIEARESASPAKKRLVGNFS